MAKPDPADTPPRLLAIELWGIGDVALAIPFLRAASTHAGVTLLAKPHAAPLLRRFAPAVIHEPLDAPWTAFRHKYRLGAWPWRSLFHVRRRLREARFDIGVSARRDPRDHTLLMLAGARRRLGFPRAGSSALLTDRLAKPPSPHRAAHWAALAGALGWEIPPAADALARPPRTLLLHTGAAQAVRRWPRERFAALADRLWRAGYHVRVIDGTTGSLDALVDTLAGADAFIGNDSGPGHLAALLGLPTFTIFGPQLPQLFHPIHPRAAWIEGAPCAHKPCFDACRMPTAICIEQLGTDDVHAAVERWLRGLGPCTSRGGGRAGS